MPGTFLEQTWDWDPDFFAPPKYRRPCRYEAFVPSDLAGIDIPISGEIAGVVSEAEKAIATLNRDAGPEMAPLARLLLRTESIASSKIEGLQVDARDLARAEAKHETGRKVGPDATEILANIDAMQFAIEEAAVLDRVTRESMLQIHGALMGPTPMRRIAGVIRDSQNWIGGNDYNPCGASFVPPPHEEVPRLLDDLALFSSEESLPPLMQAAIAHAQFETIHPFADGNGRTGRALIQVILRRRGITPNVVPPISVILAAQKDRYIDGLTAFREDRLDRWLEVFCVATQRAANRGISYRAQVAELQEGWRDQLRVAGAPRADAAAWSIIDILPAHPVITTLIATTATGRTRPAVTNALANLAAAGILIPLGTSTRNRAWEAGGLLDLITELDNSPSADTA